MSGSHLGIGAEVTDLKLMKMEDLRTRWRAIFGKRPPDTLPKYLLVSMIAYDLQAQQFGHLGKDQARYLDAVRNDGGRATTLPSLGRSEIGKFTAGTVFVREHDGITHHVTAASEGFIWNGNTYSSLSAVARAITGTNWNGPRFFGLSNTKRGNQ